MYLRHYLHFRESCTHIPVYTHRRECITKTTRKTAYKSLSSTSNYFLRKKHHTSWHVGVPYCWYLTRSYYRDYSVNV